VPQSPEVQGSLRTGCDHKEDGSGTPYAPLNFLIST
jgi:hypothetical protein